MFLLRQALRRLVRRHLRSAACDRGVSGVEHGILAGLVAVAIIGAVALVGGQLAAMFTGATYALRGETPPQPAVMVLTYDTATCGRDTIELPVGGTVDGTVDWGDGTASDPLVESASHTYAAPGEYTVTIDGTFTEFSSMNYAPGSAECLRSVDRWGDTGTVSAQGAFYQASRLTSVAKPPATITDMSHMFALASSFNQDISSWDVSRVTNMDSMFYLAINFNQDISSWDTGSVEAMGTMFYRARSFNQDLNGWDTGNVTDMTMMFADASSFNGDISSWNTTNVMYMGRMFENARSFNRDLSGWKTGAVTEMGRMFRGASSFDHDLSGWDTTNVWYYDRFDEGATAWQDHHKPVFS